MVSRGVSAFKTETLTTGSNTNDGPHSFQLAEGQALVHMSIALGAGSGPVEANGWIYNEGDTNRPIILNEATFIRASNVFGAPDVWTYTGRSRYQSNSTLRVWVRNDSGSTITWIASWRTEL